MTLKNSNGLALLWSKFVGPTGSVKGGGVNAAGVVNVAECDVVARGVEVLGSEATCPPGPGGVATHVKGLGGSVVDATGVVMVVLFTKMLACWDAGDGGDIGLGAVTDSSGTVSSTSECSQVLN